MLAIIYLLLRPVLLDVFVLRSLAVEDAVTVFSPEHELIIITLDVSSAADQTSARAGYDIRYIYGAHPIDMSRSASTLCDEGPSLRSIVWTLDLTMSTKRSVLAFSSQNGASPRPQSILRYGWCGKR